MKKILFAAILLIFFSPAISFAHPGRTDASGGHTCRTNCEKWGLSYGEYHYHNSSGTSSSYALPSYYSYPSAVPSSSSFLNSGYSTPSLTTKVYGGEIIAGTLFCDFGYYKNSNACILAPINSTAYGQENFYCNSGYVENVQKNGCVSFNDFCSNEFGLNSEYNILTDKCACKTGYQFNEISKGKYSCLSYSDSCKKQYGSNSYGDKDLCYCVDGFEFNSQKTNCVEKTKITTPTPIILPATDIIPKEQEINIIDKSFKLAGNELLRKCAKKTCKVIKHGSINGTAKIIEKNLDWYKVEVTENNKKTIGWFKDILIPKELK